MNMERCGVPLWTPGEDYRVEGDALEDRWIFSRLNASAAQINRAIETHRYHEAAQTLWHFFWHDFCDWYVELKKLRFQENSGLNADWRNLLAAFEAALRLLHPVMPFLTEELWQRLTASQPDRVASIALARFPEFREDFADAAAERDMELLQAIVGAARNLRTDMKLDPKAGAEGVVYARGAVFEAISAQRAAIQKLANLTLEFRDEAAPANAAAIRSTADFDLVLSLPMAQLDAQRQRLAKDKEQLEKIIANSNRQLQDETFLGKAPAKVVDGIRAKLADYQTQLHKIDASLAGLG